MHALSTHMTRADGVDGGVVVQAHQEEVPHRACGVQRPHVTGMKQVEGPIDVPACT